MLRSLLHPRSRFYSTKVSATPSPSYTLKHRVVNTVRTPQPTVAPATANTAVSAGNGMKKTFATASSTTRSSNTPNPSSEQQDQHQIPVPPVYQPPPPASTGPVWRDPRAFPATTNFESESSTTTFNGENGWEDLSVSYRGASVEPFSKEVREVLLAEIPAKDIEVKPDGMIYLPEIKYRRILNRAFGPGAWSLVPRGPHTLSPRTISREYALFVLGRFVSQARGEQDYFSPEGLPTATEGCKSNALMRCCKDLGIASELWDPGFIREFKREHAVQVWGVMGSGGRKLLWRRKDRTLEYPYKEEPVGGAAGGGGAGAAKSGGFVKR
ncbi:hypothetical protein HDV05_002313 [Chytridiales sp. JEL 0842]|nr:hypothetical protein HDV05_002313 [Chytridiales sp. JEL 0842]